MSIKLSSTVYGPPRGGGLVVTVRRSKADQEGRGRKVAIPHARGNACPVDALETWLAAAEIAEGPVFRSISRYRRVSSRRLSAHAVALVVKVRAGAAGLEADRYSGHSLRAGLATSAATAGVSYEKIQAQTGHKSRQMLDRYVRDGQLFRNNAAGIL